MTSEDIKHQLIIILRRLSRLATQTTPKVQMQVVIFHVGVNSVHHGPVSEKSWFDLVSLFRRAYPRASLRASSILPSCRASRSFRLNISRSNNALLSVCVRTGVQYIDNTVTFQTQTGAPRQALYKDKKHPSHRGFPSLISLMISVDVKHHVYLLSRRGVISLPGTSGSKNKLCLATRLATSIPKSCPMTPVIPTKTLHRNNGSSTPKQ